MTARQHVHDKTRINLERGRYKWGGGGSGGDPGVPVGKLPSEDQELTCAYTTHNKIIENEVNVETTWNFAAAQIIQCPGYRGTCMCARAANICFWMCIARDQSE